MPGDLFALPWQIQLVIVSGYIGYNIAYAGIRVAHQTLDTISIILAFGGIGLVALHIADSNLRNLFELPSTSLVLQTASALVAITSTICASVLWRRYRSGIKRLLAKISNSREDGLPTAWHSITLVETLKYVHLTVTLKNGRVYESYPLSQFNGIANGPCVLGTDGSIGMFVTKITEKDGEERDARNLQDSEGYRITYIPKDAIEEIDFRRE